VNHRAMARQLYQPAMLLPAHKTVSLRDTTSGVGRHCR
jgi:hypothetical protein